MARISTFDESTWDRRRAAVTLAVVAAHVVLVMVLLRSAGLPADVVDITLFALPINPEDRPREPVHVQKPPLSRPAETAPRRAAVARESATEQHSEPVPPIDWHAEIETSAHALEQHDNIESGRRSLAGPKGLALSAAPQKPACPYEKCEPGWGESLGIFKPSLHSKAGRVENVPNDMTTLSDGSQNPTGSEVVRWINNWCCNILVSPDPERRGRLRCFFPLGKTAATRGDLFDHMDESRPPHSDDTDSPWISYGLSIGVSRGHRIAP